MSKCSCNKCKCKEDKFNAPNMIDGFCPYCGGKMFLQSHGGQWYYGCSKCHARSPLCKDREEALALAMIAIGGQDIPFTLLAPHPAGDYVVKGKPYVLTDIVGSYNDVLSFRAMQGGSDTGLIVMPADVIEEADKLAEKEAKKSKSKKKSNCKKSANDNSK